MRARESRNAGLWSVILAAGASRRLGEPKQMLRLRGKPLLLHAADRAARTTGQRVVVVLGAHALRLRATLAGCRPRPRVVYNGDWPSGMASSLRRGIAALPPSARGALLLLTDQPRVSERSLQRLAAAWRARPQRAAAAYYEGRAGTPAILPRRAFKAARKLHGDVGARRLLRSRSNPHASRYLRMPEAAWDIDTVADRRSL
jgi:molybdenum cofactor cytidylyltransferase